jgi:tRNA uridine 5-carboxymethylaminomethyl modification enzyme
VINGKKRIIGVKTHTGAIFRCKAVVLTTGTYLKARIIIGDVSYNGGPDGMFPANKLSDSLKSLVWRFLGLRQEHRHD